MNKVPKRIKDIDKNGELENLWEDVFKARIKKHGNKKRAKVSADAAVYSECLKRFIKEEING